MRKIGEYKMLDNAVIDDVMSGEVLKNGYRLKQQFSGTYYNQETRIIGDFGSMMYVVEPLEEEHDENI
jgi:alpha-galactosidase